MIPRINLVPGDALVVVDIQNDFLTGGTLAVPDSDSIISTINTYIAEFRRRNLPVYATRDWHPSDHDSFVDQGGPWPPHCVAGSHGAEFSSALDLPETPRIVSTGVEKSSDGYSAFAETGFQQDLQHAGIKRLFVCGIATDYCVLQTVLDALRLNYQVFLLTDAISAVNVAAEDGEKATQKMLTNGAETLTVNMIL